MSQDNGNDLYIQHREVIFELIFLYFAIFNLKIGQIDKYLVSIKYSRRNHCLA